MANEPRGKEAVEQIVAGAIYDFLGMLTCIPTTDIGSGSDCTKFLKLMSDWAEKRGLNLDHAEPQEWKQQLDRFTIGVDQMRDVAEFHHKFKIEQPSTARTMPRDLGNFRVKFMDEEVTEFERAQDDKNLEGQIDSLVDLCYVAVGTALICGFDFDEAWRRVHAKNMLKIRALPDGSNSTRMSKYDVVKPAGWTPPSHADLVHPDHIAPVQASFAILDYEESETTPT